MASAERQRSNLPDAALAVADTLLILGLLATLMVGTTFVVFVHLHRKYFAAENSNRDAVLLVERGVGNDHHHSSVDLSENSLERKSVSNTQ